MPSTSTSTVTIPSDVLDWTVIDGLPGRWRRLRTRLAVSARAADGVVVDGRLVDGLQLLEASGPARVEVDGRCVELVDDGVAVVTVLRRCA